MANQALAYISAENKKILRYLATRDGRSENDIISDMLKLYVKHFKDKREPIPSKRGRPRKGDNHDSQP